MCDIKYPSEMGFFPQTLLILHGYLCPRATDKLNKSAEIKSSLSFTYIIRHKLTNL